MQTAYSEWNKTATGSKRCRKSEEGSMTHQEEGGVSLQRVGRKGTECCRTAGIHTEGMKWLR